MDLTPALIAAAATLTGAAIAATVSFVVTVLSKEQKTSEFRQAWTDALRNDIAEWISEVAIIYSMQEALTQSGEKIGLEATERRYSNFLKIRMLRSRIQLRLNPTEHLALITAMDQVGDGLKKGRDDGEKALAAVVVESQRALKKEWLRVRRGEPSFQWAKRVAGGIVVLALASIAILTLRAL